ncbi:unnamed protein product [Brachionus calyciflorus]|uniref:Ubiquitin-like protease family profile domain-containing protein n=1 Tax=Brachionus calyciflorus TaxID=104777 RepID=A0A813WVQ0_9BILA|nr:unnamed protein product [Brachionus calyciflorus]
MNSIQLEKILESNPQTNKTFIGIYARNELPIIKSYPCCFILNTTDRSHEGMHWLAIYYDKHKTCNFFDSYGNSQSNFGLNDYIDKYSNGSIYKKTKIQSVNSDFCGYYFLLFLILRCNGNSIEKFQLATSFMMIPVKMIG